MHLLGQVGRGVVDHYPLARVGGGYVELLIIQRFLQLGGQPGAILEEVDEAGAGDAHLGHRCAGRQGGDDLLGQIARLQTGGLGQRHRQVAGEVPMALVAGGLHLNVRADVGGQHALGLQGADGAGEQLADEVFHEWSRFRHGLWKTRHYPT